MKTLLTITEQDFDSSKAAPMDDDAYPARLAARAVVFDADGKVAILNVSKRGYHKLPGGGVEKGEDMTIALERELLEEIGCRVEVYGEVGEIIEYKDIGRKVRQVSHCYLANQVGEKGEPDFTGGELDDGFEIMWVENIDQAIAMLENDEPTVHEGGFMVLRDLTLLKAAKDQLEK